jgi:hypothetical protein
MELHHGSKRDFSASPQIAARLLLLLLRKGTWVQLITAVQHAISITVMDSGYAAHFKPNFLHT